LIDNVVAPTLTVAEFRTRAWVVIAILLVESITHLLLFAFCRSLRASLYFAILTGGLGGVTSLRLVGEQSMVAIGAMMAVCLLSALLFIYSVFYARPPKFLYVAAVACLATVMAILVDWQFYLLLSLLCVVVGLEVLRVVLAAIIQRKPGRWLIGTSALGLVSWMAIFSVLMLFSDTQQMWAIPTAVILLPMLVHVSREFARVSRGLEQKIVEVERVSGESLEYERALRREIERELQTAHDMQMGLMPTGPPELLGLEIAGRCVPMNHVGGDIFQYHPREDGVAVAMADVTGHAMEAAIPVVMFSGILDKQIEISGDLSEQFSGLNRSLCRSLADHKYICFTMAEIDTETKSLRLANSGCPYPVHYHDGEITELQVDAYPLGVRPDTTYEVLEDQLFPGDYLVLYSDGIPETVNAGDEMFGFEAAAAAVQAACAEGVSAEEVIERLMGAAREFAGDEPQADDMTCVVVRVEAEPVQ
jgi:serine phosphatase RsbU (regulator of sigma subunit)